MIKILFTIIGFLTIIQTTFGQCTISVDAGPDISICQGSLAELSASGGASYQWSPASGLSNPNIANPVASPGVATKYIVFSTDINGCTGKDSVTVNVMVSPVVNAGPDLSICKGNSITLRATGGVTYQWSPTSGLSSSNVANPIASPGVTTTYTVSATDMNGCSGSDNVTVSVSPLPIVNAGPDFSVCEGNEAELRATGNGSFFWSPFDNLSDSLISDPVAKITTTTTFKVQLRDANGCVGVDNVVVTVIPNVSVFAGADTTYCISSFSEPIQLNGVFADVDSISWHSNAEGSFNDYTLADPIYQPDASNTTETIQFIVGGMAFRTPNICFKNDTVFVTRHLLPIANAGPDQYLHDTTEIHLNDGLTSNGIPSWQSSGNGTFRYNQSQLNNIYEVTEDDLLSGKLIFELKASNKSCVAIDTMVVEFGDYQTIAGNIHSNTSPAPGGTVELYHESNGSFQLYSILKKDQLTEYHFSVKDKGNFIILAKPEDKEGQTHLPTYFLQSASWESAYRVTNYGRNEREMNFSLLTKPSSNQIPTGQDFISGTVHYETRNARLAAVEPLKNGIVYLLNSAGNVINYTYTDENGRFSFDKVSEGIFYIKVDFPGASVVTNKVTTDGDPETISAHFISVSKQNVITQVRHDDKTKVSINLYPNPVNDYLYLNIDAENVTIYNTVGSILSSVSDVPAGKGINIEELKEGIYMLELIHANNVTRKTFVKR